MSTVTSSDRSDMDGMGAGLRVAHIGPLPPEFGGRTPGGVATHLRYLAEGLAGAGVHVSLLATNVPAESPGRWRGGSAPFELYRHFVPDGTRTWGTPAYLGAVGPGRAIRYAASLAARQLPGLGSRRDVLANLLWYRHFLAVARPDVVHVQHPLERHAYAHLVRALEGWRVPLVVTLHSFFGEHPDGQIRTLMAPNLRRADRFIAVSPHVAEQAEALGVDRSRVRVIRSGVDTERFRPRDRAQARARLSMCADLPLVLFVGNLEPRKAVDRLVRAMPRVREAAPEVQLVVVGGGESAGADNQEQALRRLVGEVRLEQTVRFLGRVSDGALLDWYAAADVFVLPSSSEAQGIAALEAMACGLPVVASAVGGLLDTIEDGRDGLLVPFGNDQALGERLVDLLLRADLRARIGAQARARVARDFTWQRAVQDTVAVYRELCPTRS